MRTAQQTIKLLLFFLPLFLCKLNAQVNLEFNRVVKEFYPYSNGDTQLIVPAGKVLKITSATVNTRLGPASTTYGYSYAKFFIDGHLLAQYYASTYTDFNYGNVLNNNPFPLWLGAGTYQVAINSFQTQGGGCSISGVEFNLTSE